MTRVLHVSETLDGGLGYVLRNLIRHQAGLGLEVAFATPSTASHAIAELERVGARHFPWEASPRPDPGVPSELATLRRIVASVGPELVHLHTSKAGFAGRLVVRGKVPTIFQPHGLSFLAVAGGIRRATLAWERFAVRWATVMLCVSDGERAIAQEAGVAGRFRVIHNGVDLSRFPAPAAGDRERARATLGLEDVPTVVCIGRLHRSKNQRLLIEIWDAVRASVPDARLILVGDGPDRDELAALRGEGVRLVGESDDVRSWLAAASIMAQPSTWEGLSLSLLEALACGRSAVVTDVPGMRETVGDEAGAVVPSRDAAAVTRAIVERLRDPSLADAEGRAGRRIVERRYALEQQLDRVSDLYDEVLQGARPPSARRRETVGGS